MTSSKQRIIIDTDPGVDDAMAIFLAAAASEQIEIVGLTTVFGNVSVEQASANADVLRTRLKQPHLPIAQGAASPLHFAVKDYPDFIHGKNGLGDEPIDYPEHIELSPLSAADFIIEQIESAPGEITLVPLGPLTNIALALHKQPSIVNKVKQVVLMGGAAFTNGNVTPLAEANIWGDPHAAERVFAAKWPVVMVGLDVTHQVVMSEAGMRKIAEASPLCGDFLYRVTRLYEQFYSENRDVGGFCVHDPATVAYLIAPELFTTRQGMVEVQCDGVGRGHVIFAPSNRNFADVDYWQQRSNVSVCVAVDDQALLAVISQHLSQLP